MKEKVNDFISAESHLIIEDWMVRKLNLSPRDAFVFAAIYAESKGEKGMFIGSMRVLAEASLMSIAITCTSLERLVNKGYVIQRTVDSEGIEVMSYRVDMDYVKYLVEN